MLAAAAEGVKLLLVILNAQSTRERFQFSSNVLITEATAAKGSQTFPIITSSVGKISIITEYLIITLPIFQIAPT